MKTYTRYKDSGISWIGDVPEHWAVFRLKHTVELFCEKTNDSTLKYIGLENIESRTGRLVASEYEPESDASQFKKGDVLFCKLRPYLAKCYLAEFDGKCSSELLVLRNFKGDAVFLKNLMLSPKFISLVNASTYGAKMPRANWGFIGNVGIVFPPLSEQKAIAEYLEKKTAQINELVSAKQKQIELLKEYKQSVIANAVTGKIDERAGSHPKDERREKINWIGYIPRHWQKRKFQYLFKERSEKNHPDEPVLCATQSRGVIPQSMYENRVVVVNTGFEGLKFVKKGDFVISLRSFQGGIEYAYYQGIISAAYTVLYISTKDLYSDYVRLLFKSVPFIGLLQTCVTGIREGQNINNDMLRRQIMPIPPLSEQKKIVAYIEKKVSSIDFQIASIENQIANLNEYKQSLISDVVTGKVKVC